MHTRVVDEIYGIIETEKEIHTRARWHDFCLLRTGARMNKCRKKFQYVEYLNI